jgi:hypothetical protein
MHKVMLCTLQQLRIKALHYCIYKSNPFFKILGRMRRQKPFLSLTNNEYFSSVTKLHIQYSLTYLDNVS